MADRQFNVLFLCTGNTAPSILAESILRKDGAGRFNAFSAGSQPKGTVNPFALKLLASMDFPTDNLRSKSWEEFAVAGAPVMDFVFTVCDNAAVEGTDLQKEAAFGTATRYLKNRISAFINLPLKSLDKMSIAAQVRAIGQLEGASKPRQEVA